jgi:hypothetical protein
MNQMKSISISTKKLVMGTAIVIAATLASGGVATAQAFPAHQAVVDSTTPNSTSYVSATVTQAEAYPEAGREIVDGTSNYARYSNQWIYVRAAAVDSRGATYWGNWIKSENGSGYWYSYENGSWVNWHHGSPLGGWVDQRSVAQVSHRGTYTVWVQFYWGAITNLRTGQVVREASFTWERVVIQV